MKHSLLTQLREVEREIAMRKQVYPGLIGRGKMRKAEADHLIDIMEQVHRSLTFLHDNRDTIKSAFESRATNG